MERIYAVGREVDFSIPLNNGGKYAGRGKVVDSATIANTFHFEVSTGAIRTFVPAEHVTFV